jgi:hypothetical protein
MARLILLVLCLLAAPLVSPLRADGFAVKNGRYAGGAVLELQLTKEQQAVYSKSKNPGAEIHLTQLQRRLIEAKGIKESPTKLWLYKISDFEGDCSCGILNVGFVFKPGWIEIPLAITCSDSELDTFEGN